MSKSGTLPFLLTIIIHTERMVLYMNKRSVDNWWGYFFIFPQLVGMLLFSLIPLVGAFTLSMMKWDGFGDKNFLGFGNFIHQFQDEEFIIAIKNTVYFTMMVVPGGIFTALLVAVALNRVQGKVFYRLIYFAPGVTSTVAVSVVFLWLLNSDFGIINLYLEQWFGIEGPRWLIDTAFVMPSIAILSIWAGLGFNMVIFLAGLQGISTTYYEAAEIDGANHFRKFLHITIPLLSPTTFFIAIMSIIGSFQVFDQSFVLTSGGPAKASYTMVYHIYELAFVDFTFGRSTAAAVILFFIILLFTLLQMYVSKKWVHYGD